MFSKSKGRETDNKSARKQKKVAGIFECVMQRKNRKSTFARLYVKCRRNAVNVCTDIPVGEHYAFTCRRGTGSEKKDSDFIRVNRRIDKTRIAFFRRFATCRQEIREIEKARILRQPAGNKILIHTNKVAK